MSSYSRDSYRRRRSEEQLMFQRMAVEQQNIQNFLLLQQDNITTESIGGSDGSDPDPYPYSVNLQYSFTGSTGSINFTSQTETEVKQTVLYALDESFNFSGQIQNSDNPITVGSQLYILGSPSTDTGNYLKITYGTSNVYEIYSLTNGVVDSITNFEDIAITGLSTFSTVGTYSWVAPYGATSVEYLVVGGGGGGANGYDNAGGGGGGAGMVLNGNLSIISGQTYSVTVGIGGTGGADARANNAGTTGGTSIFDTIIALGGGMGLGSRTAASAGVAQSTNVSAATGGGGSGGGFGGKGGGGASTNGSNNSGASGGAGGAGVSYSTSGSSVTYGVGGAGGGAGAPTTDGADGTANRGNGGGAGRGNSGDSAKGGNGGSGIVIIKYY